VSRQPFGQNVPLERLLLFQSGRRVTQTGAKPVLRGSTPHEQVPAIVVRRVLPLLAGATSRHTDGAVTQWHWDPETYLANMLAEVPAYEQLQEQTAAATDGVPTGTILELGIGTGETARRVGARHPGATLVAVDSSAEMLERARAAFPGADLRLARLEDPLPSGPFDLVVSALAVHHLDADGKRDLFRRVAAALRPGGRFVLADVVVPELEGDAITPIDRVMDLPHRANDQLEWLREAGLDAELLWSDKDLVVMRARRPT
jgi:tRNA (cmo5U34)-methyltransferase